MADSANVQMVWEWPYYPTYYFPTAEVDMGLLSANGQSIQSENLGHGDLYDLVVDSRSAQGAGRIYADTPELQGLIRLDWAAMDAWFEEDEQVYVHARNPYARVDVLASSRPVRVEIDGQLVAESTRAQFLFETGLPTRYYLPKTDVQMDLLVATDLHTECPYKGVASYYSVQANSGRYENIAWWYPFPTRESANIAGMISFYNEKVDIWVDGEPLIRPTSPVA